MKVYIPSVLILLAISILALAGCTESEKKSQPVDPSSIFEKSLEAGSNVQSYRAVIESLITIEGETRQDYSQLEFVAPDRIRQISKDRTNEVIQIGTIQYSREKDSGYWISINQDDEIEFPLPVPDTELLIRFIPGEPSVPIPIDTLDWKKMPNEIIDEIECLHLVGEVDMNAVVDGMIEMVRLEQGELDADRLGYLDRMRQNKQSVEIWIGTDDYLIRQGKGTSKQLFLDSVDDREQWTETSSLIRYYDFNTPIGIEPPANVEPRTERIQSVPTKTVADSNTIQVSP